MLYLGMVQWQTREEWRKRRPSSRARALSRRSLFGACRQQGPEVLAQSTEDVCGFEVDFYRVFPGDRNHGF